MRDVAAADGFRVCYDRECPFEMRLQHEEGGQEVGPIEAVKVKILIQVRHPLALWCRVSCCDCCAGRAMASS